MSSLLGSLIGAASKAGQAIGTAAKKVGVGVKDIAEERLRAQMKEPTMWAKTLGLPLLPGMGTEEEQDEEKLAKAKTKNPIQFKNIIRYRSR